MVMKFHYISLFKVINGQSKIWVLEEIPDSDCFFIDSWENFQVFVSDLHGLEELMFLALDL
jgi:hypothetical protein